MDLVEAGTTAGTVTIDYRTVCWKVMATTAATVTVQFNDRTTITIPSTNTGYVEVPGDFQKIVVSGGTVAYMIFE